MEDFRRGELVLDVNDSGPSDGPVVFLLHPLWSASSPIASMTVFPPLGCDVGIRSPHRGRVVTTTLHVSFDHRPGDQDNYSEGAKTVGKRVNRGYMDTHPEVAPRTRTSTSRLWI